jgi:hypothetical protein
MKKIQCDNIDHILLTEEEYTKLVNKAEQKAFIIAGIEVQAYIPFDNVMCGNWNDSYNFRGYCGIMFKGEKISVEQLKNILNIYKEEQGSSNPFPKYFSATAYLDGRNLERDIPTIKRLVTFIEKYMESKTSFKDRELQYISPLCQ